MIEIKNLDKENMARYMNDLIHIDRDALHEYGVVFSSEQWKEKHFKLELPGKWDLSVCAVERQQIGAFCVCTYFDASGLRNCFINRIIVSHGFKKKERVGAYWMKC